MRIYSSETVIEVTEEEIKSISSLINFAEENDLNYDYEDFYCLLEAIADTRDRRSFSDNCDRVYTIKRVEK